MKKPLIGIIPLVDEEKDSFWMLPGYMTGVEQAGGIPVMLPLTTDEENLKQLADTCDGFLLSGGHDVSPRMYGQEPSEKCGASCLERDEMETILFRLACEKDKSILGICRGIQIINAMLGGTLYQDLPTEYPSHTEHHQKPPYEKPCHAVSIAANSPLHDLLQKDTIQVNSYHHQAVKDLAPGLESMAVSEDGLIEAVRLTEKKFVWGVQWHPEFSYVQDSHSQSIFKKFIQSSSVH